MANWEIRRERFKRNGWLCEKMGIDKAKSMIQKPEQSEDSQLRRAIHKEIKDLVKMGYDKMTILDKLKENEGFASSKYQKYFHNWIVDEISKQER